ncbi:hypothetical protein [Aureibacter tunicatorum]|uniref:Uncharacterized protein n=1 Tax=Aureibacter tunicatorum TaxID=866807 RepID=A0AAE4BTT4_9BACT|nr:hypothetical protein [Aureibacter tunicatorum]MDR6240295.1 hypothetical protein [Aureibacter tunicatorum]BDD05824.1 hypothetical protein AUTU_33070 [Aureibacter tunicatorum]
MKDLLSKYFIRIFGSLLIICCFGAPVFSQKLGDKVVRETIPDFLKTPAENYVKEVPIVIVSYLPLDDNQELDRDVTGAKLSLESMKTKLMRMNIQSKFMLEEGTKYKGYENPDAVPFAGYRVVDYLIVYDDFKEGMEVPWNKGWYRPDYFDVMETIDGKYYVEELGVKEVWLWGWHHGTIEPAETNMASPLTADISNSERTDDLPIYNSTYMLYNYNMNRTANQAVHNHGHQIEAAMMHANEATNGNQNLFLNAYVGWDGKGDDKRPPLGRVGDTHHPPNTTKDYDYLNPTLIESDIMDWNPDGSGEKKMVNCFTWGNLPYQWPDGLSTESKIEAHWYIFWMQNMPGYNNELTYKGEKMNNWWEYKIDWDYANGNNIGLFGSPKTSRVN